MAQAETSILISVIDKASDTFKKIGSSVDSFSKKMEPAFKTMAVAGTAAFGAITLAVKNSIDAYAESERWQRQLEHAVIGVSKGTEEQVTQINAITAALQKKVGVDADSLNAGVAQLSTFGLQTQSVIDLTKSLADLTVNQNGLNASAEDYIGNANTIAKALNGQFGVLEKSGIRFTELQQNMILYGTEAEKVKALQEGFSQNLRETTDSASGADVALAKTKRTFEDISENLGKSMLPALGKLLDKVSPIIERFADWSAQNPDLLAKIILITGSVSVITSVLGALGLAIPKVIDGVKKLVGVFKEITWQMTGWGIAIVAIIAIGILLYKHWDEIKAKAIEIWTSITDFFTDIWDAVSTKISEVWTSITNFFTQTWEAIKNGVMTAFGAITDFFTTIWEGIKNIFTFATAFIIGAVILLFKAFGIDIVEVFKTIKDNLVAFWDALKTKAIEIWTAIKDFFALVWEGIKFVFQTEIDFIKFIWESVWQAISDFIMPIWEGIKTTLQAGWTWITDLFNKATKPLSDAWSGLWNGIKTTAVNVFENIKDSIKGMINWIIDKLNFFIRAANKIADAGNVIPGVSVPHIPDIPYLAKGGIVNKPTLAMIGEAGPEAVVPLKGRNAVGGSITINITGNTLLDQQSAEKIGDMIIKKLMLTQRIR